MNVNLIVAVDKNTHGIGKNGRIPWNNKDDMKWFKKVTTGGNSKYVSKSSSDKPVFRKSIYKISIRSLLIASL